MTKSSYPKKGARPRQTGPSRKAASAAREAGESRTRMKVRILANTGRISVLESQMQELILRLIENKNLK